MNLSSNSAVWIAVASGVEELARNGFSQLILTGNLELATSTKAALDGVTALTAEKLAKVMLPKHYFGEVTSCFASIFQLGGLSWSSRRLSPLKWNALFIEMQAAVFHIIQIDISPEDEVLVQAVPRCCRIKLPYQYRRGINIKDL